MKTLNHQNGCWLECMDGKAQKCIITDQSLAMKNAIDAVLPSFFIWHIMNGSIFKWEITVVLQVKLEALFLMPEQFLSLKIDGWTL